MRLQAQPVLHSNLADYLTVGIKTFHRPKCLAHCIASVRQRHSDIPIIVADDSDSEMKEINKAVASKIDNIRFLELPFNSGLSYGRNRLTELTQTPYFLNLDDDNHLVNNSRILNMISFLEERQDYDLIAGICPNRATLYNPMSISYSMCFDKIQSVGSKKFIKTKPNSEVVKNNFLKETYKTNLTLNLFVARTLLLKSFPWNEQKPLGEHEEFFVSLYQNNINCAISYEVEFGEIIDERRDYEYTFEKTNIHDLYTKEYEFV